MQVSSKLRRSDNRLWHWCAGCERLHPLPWPDCGWTFNGNFERPTMTPSFMQEGGHKYQCHYILTDGVLNYCADSWHSLAGKSVPLPDLPARYHDFEQPVTLGEGSA